MTPNALSRDELIEAMRPLGNHPVVWSGVAGLVKDAVGAAVLTRHGESTLISLQPAKTQSNVGNVLTTPHVLAAGENLRVAKNRFADSFDRYVEGYMTKLDFIAIKRDFDSVISQVIDTLSKEQ
jgi:hypothetical protein